MNRRTVACTALLAAVVASGCAAPQSRLTSADFPERMGGLKRLGVVVAEARVMNLRGEGGSELDAEASAQGAAWAEAAARQSLAERGYGVAAISGEDARAIAAAYLDVREGIAAPFAENHGRIEGLPPLAGVPAACASSGVDGIVFVGALDQVSTGGRKVFMKAMVWFGFYGGRGTAHADLSAVDCTGRIFYYDRKSGKDFTLAKDEDVQEIVGELVAGLPPAGGK